MKRVLLAACLFAAPGLAAAQADEFTPNFNPFPPSRVFPITNLGDIVGVEARTERAVAPLATDAEAFADGEVLLLSVEGDGVRMPDEQLSLD